MTSRERRLLDRPGRLAAIGGSVAVCVLSLSGALGISDTGSTATDAHPPGTARDGGATGDGAGASGASGASADRMAAGGQRPHPEGSRTPAQGTTLPARSGSGYRVVFDVSAQRVWLVNADNSVERTYLVSGSRYHNLANGTYQVTSHSRHATAYNSDETMRFMVRFARGRTSAIGFHSIPTRPDGTLVEARSSLGTPESDGCIRQWITDARALWGFAAVGTTVVVRT